MKKLALILLGSALLAGQVVYANTEICEKLLYEAEQHCTEVICAESGFPVEVCPKDGDFYVLKVECTYDTFDELVAEYNQENPGANLTCEDIEL